MMMVLLVLMVNQITYTWTVWVWEWVALVFRYKMDDYCIIIFAIFIINCVGYVSRL